MYNLKCHSLTKPVSNERSLNTDYGKVYFFIVKKKFKYQSTLVNLSYWLGEKMLPVSQTKNALILKNVTEFSEIFITLVMNKIRR